MALGRPTKYRKEYCEMLLEHQAKGLSFASFAGLVKVTHETLNEWAKKYPDLSAAKKKGNSECLLFWERMGIQGAAGKLKGFNTAAWIFQMKNRFQWRDRTPEEVKEDRRPIVIVRPSTGEREVLGDNRTIDAEAHDVEVKKK